LQDNYHKAKSTVFSGWHDSELRDYLVQHGLVKSDYAAQRDDMIKLIGDKYQASTSAPYLAWPDARLRAYLRDHVSCLHANDYGRRMRLIPSDTYRESMTPSTPLDLRSFTKSGVSRTIT